MDAPPPWRLKLLCAFCGRANSPGATVCNQCGGSLAGVKPVKLPHLWAAWAGALIAIAFLAVEYDSARRIRAKVLQELQHDFGHSNYGLTTALKGMDEAHEREQKALETAQRELLGNPRILSGELASARHAEEWQRRQNHDPAFASSILEQALLQIQKLGSDPAVASEQALREVARMVAPEGSRIEVTPSGNRFVVRVAFRLGSVMPQEAGGSTKHTSSAEMRREIQEVCARMIQALFDYCGTRGIERLSVSCNRALSAPAPLPDEPDKLEMRSVFRASVDAATAATVTSWRRLSLPEIVSLLKVERDIVSTITIHYSLRPNAPLDPNALLEF